jgi:superoxide reductase
MDVCACTWSDEGEDIMAKKFYLCKTCGNIIGLIKDGGGPLTCCGAAMEELVPNTVDAAQEKHVPVLTF